MCVDLLGLMLVQADEAVQDIVARRTIVVATLVIREVVLHRADRQLLLEPIDLVEEENDGRLDEPPRVADRIEESEGFLHAVDRLIFEKKLIILGDSDKEQDGGDVFEAVDPLLPLRSLATDIEHPVRELADDERRLGNTSRLDTRPQNILIVGQVVGGGNAGNVVEVAANKSALCFGESINAVEDKNLLSR